MINCPVCEEKIQLSEEGATCAGGHVFSLSEGVYQILSPDYKQKLDTFLDGFEDFREEAILKYTPEVLQNLPFVSFDIGMWKLRQYDLTLVSKYFKSGKKVLEIGAWNAWLTHHMAGAGMDVTAVDIFVHDRDGLAAKKHFKENWRAIQMDLQRLDLIDEKFDLIIVNRSFQYFEKMHDSIETLKGKLKKGGILLLTGLTLESDKERIRLGLETAAKNFESKYGTPFRLHNYQGFNTEESFKRLKEQKVRLHVYPQLRIRSFIGYFSRKHHRYYYGIFEKG